MRVYPRCRSMMPNIGGVGNTAFPYQGILFRGQAGTVSAAGTRLT